MEKLCFTCLLYTSILEYFKNATQIGMTATPKETKDTSNIEYFGEPIYTYTLRKGCLLYTSRCV